MPCQTEFDDMMSLALDGMLDGDESERLQRHVSGCSRCSPLWSAMCQADSLLSASAREPLPISADFTLTVMQRVAATPVYRPQVAPALQPHMAALDASVLPEHPGPVGGYEETPLAYPDFRLPEQIQLWQARAGQFMRGIAAVVGAAAVGVGLVLALIISGTLQVGGILAPSVDTLRAFLRAVSTWAGSLLNGLSTQALIGAALVLALVSFAGWQIVSGYHYAVGEQSEVAAGEVLA